MVAKSIEAFKALFELCVGGVGMNCRFTGHVVRGGLFFRVAKNFLSYARHFSCKDLDWDTKLIGGFELFNNGGSRGSR